MGQTKKKQVNRIQQAYIDFNNNGYVSQGMAFIIMVSIFGDDLRRVFLPKAYDSYVDYFMLFLMFLFILEMISNSLVLKLEYLCSFVFAFDLLSTCSMLLDVTLISEDYMSSYESGGSGQATSNAASEFGTKLGKLLRMVRLVRLLRLSKALSKSSQGNSEQTIDLTEIELRKTESELKNFSSLLEKSSLVGDA